MEENIMQPQRQKGIVILFIILILIGCGGYYYFKHMSARHGSATTSATSTTPTAPHPVTYSDPVFKYSFTYPSDWVKVQGTGLSFVKKEHSTGGFFADFSIQACSLEVASCAAQKTHLDKNINDKVTISGKDGVQGVTSGITYTYKAVIENNGFLFVITHKATNNQTRYPSTFDDKEVKAVIDSIKFN
jgi:hypothetical protein